MCKIIALSILRALNYFKHLWDKLVSVTDRIHFLPLCYKFNFHPIQSDFIKVSVIVVVGCVYVYTHLSIMGF